MTVCGVLSLHCQYYSAKISSVSGWHIHAGTEGSPLYRLQDSLKIPRCLPAHDFHTILTTNRIFPSVAPELKKRIVSANYFFIQFQCNLSIGLRPVESSRNNMIAGAGRAAIVLAPPNMFWEMRWCPRPRPLRLPQPQRTAFTSSACSSSDTPISRPTNDGNKVSASTTALPPDCAGCNISNILTEIILRCPTARFFRVKYINIPNQTNGVALFTTRLCRINRRLREKPQQLTPLQRNRGSADRSGASPVLTDDSSAAGPSVCVPFRRA